MLVEEILLKIIPELDFIVKGEGEKTFLEICALGLDDPYRIKGLIFRDEDKIVTSGSRPLIKDLDSLQFPARPLLVRSQSVTSCDYL